MSICMSGTYSYPGDKQGALWVILHNDGAFEVLVGDATGTQIISAYKQLGFNEYAYNSYLGKEIAKDIKQLSNKCKEKGTSTVLTAIGTAKRYTQSYKNMEFVLDKQGTQLCGLDATLPDKRLFLEAIKGGYQVPTISYVTLKNAIKQEFESGGQNKEPDVLVRSLEEIALSGKDTTWLRNKKYYVINDESIAENLFLNLEAWNGLLVLDYETTGLRMNMFGEIGGEHKKRLEEVNKERVEKGLQEYRSDKVVGVIFCVQPNVGYYLPVGHRKFKNLYESNQSSITYQLKQEIKARYTVGELRNETTAMASYIRETGVEEISNDVVLMERVRKILTTKPIGAHHGSFEYKCTMCYSMDLNLKEDSMLLHQLLYKFKGSKSPRGEKSDLKTLTDKEFGIEQLSLHDFFVDYEDNESGYSVDKKKRSKKKAYIDFSYMDYVGTEAYGPADGDFTYQLIIKYKSDLINLFPEKLRYLYEVEILVACAIGYMEFYGHRIDEDKIKQARISTVEDQLLLERDIRNLINFNSNEELEMFEEVERLSAQRKKLEKAYNEAKLTESKGVAEHQELDDFLNKSEARLGEIREAITNSDRPINLNAPEQVATLLYDRCGVPLPDDGKRSVQKRSIKPFAKAKDKNNKLLYPVVSMYLEWKNCGTLLQKFFGSLVDFMYPGGFIFSNYGQITTATGRMSCSKPNAQQYPKAITKMVIPREDCIFVDADYSQIEYRTMVALSGEPYLMEKFKDPDTDYHTIMASLMYGVPYAQVTDSMRSDAKTFNFGIPYGMGIKKLAFQLLGREDDEAVAIAKEKYNLYFKDQPMVKAFLEAVKENARDSSRTETKWGRTREFNFYDENGNIDEKTMGGALRQAANAVIQGSAADIFKIGVARNFAFIRRNKLFGKMFITNMIHDEQLVEVNFKKLNVKAILANMIYNMQELNLSDFPPLYVGAGVGKTWKEAKDKFAEIHPILGMQIMHDYKNENLFTSTPQFNDMDEVMEHFSKINYEFRENKVLDYVKDESNYNDAVHPVISALLKLQFDGGVSKKIEAMFLPEEEGITWTKDAKNKAEQDGNIERVRLFMEAHGIPYTEDMFKINNLSEDEEVDADYDDDDENDFETDAYGDVVANDFKIINEDNIEYGCDIKSIIAEFGIVISPSSRTCGIDTGSLSQSKLKEVCAYLTEHACEPTANGALNVVFLVDGANLTKTDVFVNGIVGGDLEAIINSGIGVDWQYRSY